MRININDFFGGFRQDESSLIEFLIEVWIGEAKVQTQKFEANMFTAGMEFMNATQKLSMDSRPMKVKLSYNYHLKDGSTNEDYIEFTNKSWGKANSEKYS